MTDLALAQDMLTEWEKVIDKDGWDQEAAIGILLRTADSLALATDLSRIPGCIDPVLAIELATLASAGAAGAKARENDREIYGMAVIGEGWTYPDEVMASLSSIEEARKLVAESKPSTRSDRVEMRYVVANTLDGNLIAIRKRGMDDLEWHPKKHGAGGLLEALAEFMQASQGQAVPE